LTLAPGFGHGCGQLEQNLLAIADDKEIKKVGDGLGIENRGAAAHDERSVLPLGRQQGQAGQIDQVEDGSVIELILQREADEIKIPQR